ncbi:MAG: CinA family protein [Sphaerochaetaceae bacterium]|nr:CinA family protein [Sphaerochaetaceae bacterium]
MTKSVELIVIGTELVRGIIQDQHCQLVSRELTHLGYSMKECIAIPDDGSIEKVLSKSAAESDVVIVTGGLGPTSDDMTRYAIAQAASVSLEKNSDCYKRLYERIGERIHGANEKQTLIPSGFTCLLNPNGTAEGFYGRTDNCLIIALPGPPREMRPMFYDYVLPLLAKEIGHDGVERDEYTTYIIAEAKLEELTEKVDSSLDWGTRFQDYKISLYVQGGDKEKRDSAIKSLRSLVGPELVQDGDVSALTTLTGYLKENKLSLSICEGFTGGLVSSLITSDPEYSRYFKGGILDFHESDPSIQADKTRVLFSSDVALSISGNTEGVSFGISTKNRSESVVINFSAISREYVRKRSVAAAFILVHVFLQGKSLVDTVSHWEYI